MTTSQLDMFAPAPAAPKCGDVCGLCVVWNGIWSADEYGAPGNPQANCTRMGMRYAAEPACPEFFSKCQLMQPRYGGKKA